MHMFMKLNMQTLPEVNDLGIFHYAEYRENCCLVRSPKIVTMEIQILLFTHNYENVGYAR